MNMREHHRSLLKLFARCGALPCLALALIVSTGCRKAEDTRSPADGDFLTLMNVGKSQYEKGDAVKAISTFEQAVEQLPTSIDARLNLANAFLAAGRSDDALQQAAQVMEMDPMIAAAHYVAGCAHLRKGNFESALRSLQEAKDIDRTVNEVSFQLGVAYEGLGSAEDAEAQWRETIEFGPDHPAAYYRLSQILLRAGNTDEARQFLDQHREVIARKTIPSDPSFLEQCVYTQMRVPFVLAQPAEKGIDVQFVDVTGDWLPNASRYGGPVGLVDFKRIGQPGLFVLEDGKAFRLLEFTNGQFAAVGNAVPASADGGYEKVLVGDLDNDRFDDVIVLGTGRSHVLKLAADGRFSDRTLLTGLAQLKATAGALADLDFTSKLSLTVALPGDGGIQFFRNMGNLMFKEDTAAMGLTVDPFAAESITIADWDKDDLPDLFAFGGNVVHVFANQRGGSFVLTNTPSAIANASTVLVRDFNNDFRWDTLSVGAGTSSVSYGGLTNTVTGQPSSTDVRRTASFDFDNDGWLDILTYGGASTRLWRNVGEKGFTEIGIGLDSVSVTEVLAADLDQDCDPDLVIVTTDGALRLFRNDGGNANRMLKFKTVGNRSNSSGIGARFELTAGDWRGMRAVSQSPLEIGVGQHEQIDSMLIQWAQLRMNLEELATAECRVSVVTEVQQAQMTSCPYLYKWNGTTFEFVSDFLSAAPVGLPSAPGRIIAADPEELLWVGNTKSFPAREGQYLLKMTEELSEVLYLDEVKLLAVDHPAGTKVFSTSKLLPGKPWLPHEIVTVHNEQQLRKATGTEGEDVTLQLLEMDAVRTSPHRFGDHLMGYANPTQLTLDFGPLDHSKPLVLAMNGWLRFGGAMGNIAASQNKSIPFPFPTLEAETENGDWAPVDVRVGAPAGRTKSIIVDLTGKLPEGTTRLRMNYAFDLYWDQIALFEKVTNPVNDVHRIGAAETDLQYRGFSITETNDWTHPTTPIHDQINHAPLVPNVPSGWVTRYGEVDKLVEKTDNAFALINGGDALTVAFDANELPPLKEGYERDFFVWSVGWDKDTDYHTIAGDRIEPLPWHGMDDQTYGGEPRPSFESDAIMKGYNVRWAGPRVPVKREANNRM